MTPGGEIFVPFRLPPTQLEACTEVRSTLVGSSLQEVRRRGLGDRYYSILPRDLHERMHSLVAGTWIPIDVAVAHYRVLDTIFPTEAEQLEMGREVAGRIHRTTFATVAKLAASAGVTPWIAFAHVPKLYERTFLGGGMCIKKLGPKEAQIEIIKVKLLDVPYFRTAYRGIFMANLELLSKSKAYVREVRSGPGMAYFRASWV